MSFLAFMEEILVGGMSAKDTYKEFERACVISALSFTKKKKLLGRMT